MDKSMVAGVTWPTPWQPLDDEYEALSLGRRWAKQPIADTVLGELHREICDSHALHGRDCVPIAYDADCPKEFLFLTDLQDSPVVLVHFTWHTESKPDWPFIKRYASVNDFIRREKRYRRKWWQFWM